MSSYPINPSVYQDHFWLCPPSIFFVYQLYMYLTFNMFLYNIKIENIGFQKIDFYMSGFIIYVSFVSVFFVLLQVLLRTDINQLQLWISAVPLYVHDGWYCQKIQCFRIWKYPQTLFIYRNGYMHFYIFEENKMLHNLTYTQKRYSSTYMYLDISSSNVHAHNITRKYTVSEFDIYIKFT